MQGIPHQIHGARHSHGIVLGMAAPNNLVGIVRLEHHHPLTLAVIFENGIGVACLDARHSLNEFQTEFGTRSRIRRQIGHETIFFHGFWDLKSMARR